MFSFNLRSKNDLLTPSFGALGMATPFFGHTASKQTAEQQTEIEMERQIKRIGETDSKSKSTNRQGSAVHLTKFKRNGKSGG